MTKLLITAAWTFSLAGALAMALAARSAQVEVRESAERAAPSSCVGVMAPGSSC